MDMRILQSNGDGTTTVLSEIPRPDPIAAGSGSTSWSTQARATY